MIIGAGSGATVVGAGTDIGASPISIAAPGGIASGDLVLFAICTANSVPNVLGPAGSGWTEHCRDEPSGGGEWHAIYSKIATGFETSFDITHSSSVNVAAGAVVFRGVDSLLASTVRGGGTLSARSIMGHPNGLDVRIWMNLVGGGLATIDPPPGDALTVDVDVTAGATNDCSILIAHRDCHAVFDVPALRAVGNPGAYGFAATMVWYAA